MLPLDHSAILSTCIKLPPVFKTFVFFSILNGCLRQVLLYLKFMTCDPWLYTIDHPKFIVSNQKEKIYWSTKCQRFLVQKSPGSHILLHFSLNYQGRVQLKSTVRWRHQFRMCMQLVMFAMHHGKKLPIGFR